MSDSRELIEGLYYQGLKASNDAFEAYSAGLRRLLDTLEFMESFASDMSRVTQSSGRMAPPPLPQVEPQAPLNITEPAPLGSEVPRDYYTTPDPNYENGAAHQSDVEFEIRHFARQRQARGEA